jgi:HAD superfamily hydrolase (TIGR01662 family)
VTNGEDTARSPTAAVFFDVDFTLIYPGPTFQGEGYHRFCARYGIDVAPSRFSQAVRAASVILDDQQEHVYDRAIFVRYTRRIIEEMGGAGPQLDACASEIYDEWAACHHFSLYDDVEPVLRELAGRGIKIGLISNSHRSMASFEQHFELSGLIAGAISSAEHGYLKPHPSIFEAALQLVGARPQESVMVGDSLAHDIEGARRVGMRGVLVHRGDPPVTASADVAVIRDLSELPALL